MQLEVLPAPVESELRARVSVGARLSSVLRAEYALVWRTVRRFGTAELDADDAAQRVFMILSSKLDQVPVGSERAFLLGCAVRVASRERRKRLRRREEDLAALELSASGPLLDELIEQRRARAALDSILEKLGDGLRSVFVLHEIEQLTMSEISDALGIAPGTVASRLRRARERFTLLAARFRRYNREWSAMRWASGAR